MEWIFNKNWSKEWNRSTRESCTREGTLSQASESVSFLLASGPPPWAHVLPAAPMVRGGTLPFSPVAPTSPSSPSVRLPHDLKCRLRLCAPCCAPAWNRVPRRCRVTAHCEPTVSVARGTCAERGTCVFRVHVWLARRPVGGLRSQATELVDDLV